MKIGEITIGPNPTMTIYRVKIDNDTMITLGRFKNGSQFTEVYTGENYVVGSEKRSYSRIYKGDDFSKLLQNAPSKYVKYLVDLKYFQLKTQEC